MKLFVYTFRTFPEIDKLRAIFPGLKVFGKLKDDLREYESEIREADWVIGIAATKRDSQIESVAVNKFGKDKQITKNGPEEYKLFIPDLNLRGSNNHTSSFCNWSAYKISQLNKKVTFVHINPKEINLLSTLK